MKNKILIAVGLIVAAALILAAIYYFTNKGDTNDSGDVETRQLNSSQVPSGFPTNFPVEAGSSVIQNYESTADDGRKQSTRIMSSTKTPQAAAIVYRDFFASLGWSLSPYENTESNKYIVIMKQRANSLLIDATADSTGTATTTVEITLTEAAQ